jgi:hypothetical protein
MAYFAKLDSDNIVTRIDVVANDVLLDDNNNEVEQNGIDFLRDFYGDANGVWVQTSYNGTIRKNYAGVGYKWDSAKDGFVPPKPHNGWTLDSATCQWQPPTACPDDGNPYIWDDVNEEWSQITR